MFNFKNAFGASPLSAIEKSILEFVYKPEFKQESTAVKTIKFIICAAAGTPICSSTATNGLFSMFAEFHGRSVTTTAIDPMKKYENTPNYTICCCFLLLFTGSADSPAATATISDPINENITTVIPSSTELIPFWHKSSLSY